MTDSGKAPETGRRAARLRLGDLLLAAGVLLAAGLLFCVLRACGTTGAEAVVMQDGREILRIRLSGEDAVYPVTTDYGRFCIKVRDGMVSVSEAPCPDQICVQPTPTATVGDSIICLPGRLTVTVTDGRGGVLPAEADT